MDALNTVPSTGTFQNIVDYINNNYDLIVDAISSLEYNIDGFCGLYTSADDLPSSANESSWAGVLSVSGFPATIYTYTDGAWVSTETTWTPDSAATQAVEAAKEEALAEIAAATEIQTGSVLLKDGSTLDNELAVPITINYAQSQKAMNASGVAETRANMYLSGFVNISDCKQFWLTNPLTINMNVTLYVLCYYSSNTESSFISSGAVSLKGTGKSYTVTCRAVPDGANYLRIASRTNFPFTMYKVKTVETIVNELNTKIAANVATSKLANMELQNLLNPSTCGIWRLTTSMCVRSSPQKR